MGVDWPGATERATVYVIDDDRSVRTSLLHLLASLGHRVRSFASADDFLLEQRPAGLSCLVTEVHLPGMGGLELQERLAVEDPILPIVFLTRDGDVAHCVRAMRAGAVDFFTKPLQEPMLLDAVQHALARNRSSAIERKQRTDVLNRISMLTPRERQVFGLVVTGLTNCQIGARLGTAEKTVKVHRGRVMGKLGADSLAGLVRLATRIEPNKSPDEYDLRPIENPYNSSKFRRKA